MRIFKTLTPRWIAAGLAVGIAWTVVSARPSVGHENALPNGWPAEEDQGPAERTQRRIERLIEQLGHEDFFIRERAQAELISLSFEAFDALSAATTHEDLEIAARARYLLGLMRVQWARESDPPEVQRLLRGYEPLGRREKLSRIRSLAELPEGAGAPALCRLVRYEKSPVLSKRAALELIGSRPPGDPPDKQLAELLRKNLGGSRQTAAAWLLTWVRLVADPPAAVDDWTKLVDEEYSLLKQSRPQTDASIVAKLVRFQVDWLQRVDRQEQTMAAIHRLVETFPEDPETDDEMSLAELLSWLIEQQAWDSVDKLTARFPKQFGRDPLLIYKLAQAQAEKGNKDQAEQTVRRALALNPGKDLPQLFRHYAVARALWDWGLVDWAQREFRHVIDTGTPGNEIVMVAHSVLAELLHDLGKELEAAEVLEGLIKTTEKQPNLPAMVRSGLPAHRSRMCYFFACHFQGLNDRAEQGKYLDKAVEADPTDVDVLIARYRLPDQTPEDREETLKLIGRAATKFRQEIAHAPDDAAPYNQFAWLVANTEGDLDAALSYSLKSIELSPTSGGLYDTLAHVYFARRDYEKAVQTQTKAAEMEPHTRAIARRLEVFRKKLEETKKQDS